MKKLIVLLLSVGILTGCVVEEKNIKEPEMNTNKIKEDAEVLLEKKMNIPITYQETYFQLFGLMVGQDEKEVMEVLGEPIKVTPVEDYWRFDKIISFQKDDIQIDIALFKGKVDEITITLTDKDRYHWRVFEEAFDGTMYKAKEELLQSEEEVSSILYYVNKEEDQWLVVQEKKDGSLILSNTYTYDLSVLKDKESIIEP